MSTKHPDLPCQKVVELVTDYLEGALTPEDSTHLEQHIVLCEACANYLAQHRTVVTALHGMEADAPAPAASPEVRATALAAFRKLRSEGKP